MSTTTTNTIKKISHFVESKVRLCLLFEILAQEEYIYLHSMFEIIKNKNNSTELYFYYLITMKEGKLIWRFGAKILIGLTNIV